MSIITFLRYICLEEGPLSPSLSYYTQYFPTTRGTRATRQTGLRWEQPRTQCHGLTDALTTSSSSHPAEAASTAPSPPAATPSAATVPGSAHSPNPSGFQLFAATFPESTESPRGPRKLGTLPRCFLKPGALGTGISPSFGGAGEGTGKLRLRQIHLPMSACLSPREQNPNDLLLFCLSIHQSFVLALGSPHIV